MSKAEASIPDIEKKKRRRVLDAAGQSLDLENASAIPAERAVVLTQLLPDVVRKHFGNGEVAVKLAAGELADLSRRANTAGPYDANVTSAGLDRVEKLGAQILGNAAGEPLETGARSQEWPLPPLARPGDPARIGPEDLARIERKMAVIERAVAENLKSQGQSAGALGDLRKSLDQVGGTVEALKTQYTEDMGQTQNAFQNILDRLHMLGNPTSEPAAVPPPAVVPAVGAPGGPSSVVANPPGDTIAPEDGADTKTDEPPTSPPQDGTSFLAAARRAAAVTAPEASQSRGAAVASRQRAAVRRVLASRRTQNRIAAAVAIPILAGSAFFVLAHPLAVKPSATKPATARVVALSATPAKSVAASAPIDDPTAQLRLGLRYLRGDGAPANEAEARLWLGRAADAGNAVAQYHLATLLAATDKRAAFQRYEDAALSGNGKAMNDLAVSFASGTGTARNDVAAVQWFEKAAARGLTAAQFNLAVLLERGAGAPKNIAAAYKWYVLAAASGDAEALARKNALSKALKPDARVQVEAEASSFTALPLDSAANAEPEAVTSKL